MIKFIRMKYTSILAVFFLCLLMLTACIQAENKTASVQKNADSVMESSSPAPVSRLPEILDSGKFKGQFTLRMFNVDYKDSSGKRNAGDIIFLQAPDGTTMLIDSGYKDDMVTALTQLKKLGISKLDYMVATHMHPDHVGGFPAVLNDMQVEKVLSSKYTQFNFVNSNAFLTVLKAKNMTIDYIKEGDTFQFGKDIKVEVLSPVGSDDVVFKDDSYSNQDLCNEQSVVMKMTFGNTSFLFTGDIQLGTETRLVEKYADKLNADFLKAPHHGYSTSSSSAFLKEVSPKVTFIDNFSIGNLDIYGRYKNAGSKVYTTGFDGMLLAVSDGKQITVVTEKDRKPGAMQP